MLSVQRCLCRRHPRRPRDAEPGFAMLLAVGASAALLLMSFTLHGVALQERLRVKVMERQQREDDLLHSAAHKLLGVLNGSHRCLLGLPLAQWEGAGTHCANPAALAALRNLEVMEVPVHLLAWQPGQPGQAGQFALQLEAGAGRTARQGRYRLRSAGNPADGAQLGSRLLGGGQP